MTNNSVALPPGPRRPAFAQTLEWIRDPVQFMVYERNQPLEGTLVAPPPFEKEPGDPRGVLRNAPF